MFTDVLPVARTGSTVNAPVISSSRKENTEFKPLKRKKKSSMVLVSSAIRARDRFLSRPKERDDETSVARGTTRKHCTFNKYDQYDCDKILINNYI